MRTRPLHRRSLLALLGAGTLAAACGRAEPARPKAERPAAASAATEKSPESEALPIVTLLGDSISTGFGLPAAEALPARLEEELARSGSPARVRGAGVSGDTTAGGLERVDYSVLDDTAVCVVALGGNDMLQGVDPTTVKANLDAIVAKLKVRKIDVVLAGMRAPPQYGSYAVEFDRLYAEVARKHGVKLQPFLLEGVALVPSLNQADGIHPNAEGVRRVAKALAPIVAGALNERARRAG